MKLCLRLLRICREKSLTKKGKRTRFKRASPSRKVIVCPIQKPIYIPLDLQINILLRLPVKSLLRFRCVSKSWSTIITSRDFRKQHLKIASSAPPCLLIAFQDFEGGKLLFVTLRNPTKTSSSSSSCLVPYKDLNVLNVQGKDMNNSARGLMSLGSRVHVGICNPGTRQIHILPQTRFKDVPHFYPRPDNFFGYDPVEDQYKLLAVDSIYGRADHKVVVLGGEERWRQVQCVTCPHITQTSGFYMNGNVYYGAARMDMESPDNSMHVRFINSIIVRFDVRLETFNIITVPRKLLPVGYQYMWRANLWARTDKTLINYGGKIGVVENPCEGSFRVWVVEDEEKEEWSLNTFHLPQSFAHHEFKVMDTFYTGEICLVSIKLSDDPFCLYYYNLEKNSMRTVTIEGLPISKLKQVRDTYVSVSDHFESFMLVE